MCIHVSGKDNASNVWKVPAIHGKQYYGLIYKAIQECRDMMPKQMSREGHQGLSVGQCIILGMV